MSNTFAVGQTVYPIWHEHGWQVDRAYRVVSSDGAMCCLCRIDPGAQRIAFYPTADVFPTSAEASTAAWERNQRDAAAEAARGR